jgi:tetraacyldisaccharide 4'-kinase
MPFYVPLLYPFAMLYGAVTATRNWLFDKGILESRQFDVPTVVVGNLSVGGTGKTPFVEFLITQLKESHNLATLSRGYGRQTKGYQVAVPTSGAEDIGDEPLQIYKKFGQDIQVVVCEKRAYAISKITKKWPDLNFILLDDAFQHRYVKADFYIMLTTYQKPFFSDHILPAGTLREHASGAKRADVLVVTKCPKSMSEKEKASFTAKARAYLRDETKIIFSSLQYDIPYPVFRKSIPVEKKAALVTGIADTTEIVQQVSADYELVQHLNFADHHHYSTDDAKSIALLKNVHPDAFILTTEKDATKLKAPALAEYLNEIPIFALPVSIRLEEEDQEYLLGKLKEVSLAKVKFP